MRNISDKVVDKIKTYILCYENMRIWKNLVEPDRPQMGT